MPALQNYYQQAKPYDVKLPNVAGAVREYYGARGEQRKLSLAEQTGQRAERADVRAQTKFEEEQDPTMVKARQKAALLTLDKAQLEHVKNVSDYSASMASQVEWDGTGQDYQDFRQHMLQELPKMGIPVEEIERELPEQVGSQADLDAIKSKIVNKSMDVGEQVDYAIKQQALKTAKGAKDTWGQPKEGLDAKGKPVTYVTNKKGEFKVIKGITPTPKKGMKVYDRDGNLIFEMGGTGDVTKKTMGTIEEKLLAGQESYTRLLGMESKFREEFQETGPRLGAAWTDIMSKLGKDVSPEDKQFLIDFKKHQRTGIENINKYIKEMTGAQMSEKEADRLRLAQPDPGEKWYKGDSPITYKAKLDDTILGARAAITRYNYYKSKGISDNTIVEMVNSGEAMDLDKLMERMK